MLFLTKVEPPKHLNDKSLLQNQIIFTMVHRLLKQIQTFKTQDYWVLGVLAIKACVFISSRSCSEVMGGCLHNVIVEFTDPRKK